MIVHSEPLFQAGIECADYLQEETHAVFLFVYGHHVVVNPQPFPAIFANRFIHIFLGSFPVNLLNLPGKSSKIGPGSGRPTLRREISWAANPWSVSPAFAAAASAGSPGRHPSQTTNATLDPEVFFAPHQPKDVSEFLMSLSCNVGKTKINHPFGMVYTTYLWWFGWWFNIVLPCFTHIIVQNHWPFSRSQAVNAQLPRALASLFCVSKAINLTQSECLRKDSSYRCNKQMAVSENVVYPQRAILMRKWWQTIKSWGIFTQPQMGAPSAGACSQRVYKREIQI